MIICADKNQFAGSHGRSNYLKHKQMEMLGAEIKDIPLPFGDYVLMNENIKETIERRGDKLKKQDLVADYKFVIDSKKDLQELYGNVIGKAHQRFIDELIIAQKMGATMIILVEESGMHSLEDVLKWDNPRMKRYYQVKAMQEQGKWMNAKIGSKPPASNQTLFKALKTIESKYGCTFMFCTRQDAGKRIIELLNGGNAKALTIGKGRVETP